MSSDTLNQMTSQLSNTHDAQTCFSVWGSFKAVGGQQWEIDAPSASTIRLQVFPIHKMSLSCFRLMANLNKMVLNTLVVKSSTDNALACQTTIRAHKFSDTLGRHRNFELLGEPMPVKMQWPKWIDRSDRRVLTRLVQGMLRIQLYVPAVEAEIKKSDDNARITMCVLGYTEVDLGVLNKMLESRFADYVQETEIVFKQDTIGVCVTIVRSAAVNMGKRKRD